MKKKPIFRVAALCLMLLAAVCITPTTISALESSAVQPSADVQNHPPIAEDISCTTYRGVAIGGEFRAVDPEGDLLSFRLMTQPKKGNVTVSDSRFLYTPNDGKKGKDSFTYVAMDSAGNISAEATVTILIEKQSTKITYSDMDGNGAHYAALRLAEEGIFVGQKIGDSYQFSPETSVTRGEFLAMCLTLADLDPLEHVSRTGFSDDADMPMWVKPYVSAALLGGIVNGYTTRDGSVVFQADSVISYAEAAVLLNNVLDISDVKGTSLTYEEAMPTWAVQAAVNLSACNVIGDISLISDQPITRAEAAQMISGGLDVLAARDSGSSLLSWAW